MPQRVKVEVDSAMPNPERRYMIDTLTVWIADHSAKLTVFLPLMTLAGSAAAYIVKLFLDLSDRRRKNFLELVELLDKPGTLASTLAAVYQLSEYGRHGDFLIRFFGNRDTIISGESGEVLKEEMRIATERLRRR